MEFLKKNNHLLLIVLGSISWILTMVKSGLLYSFGMGFWGPNGHDAIWHLALINHFSKGNFQMPVFAGESLKNYHIGFDYFLSTVHTITQIPSTILYFQIMPLILSLLIGWLTYKFVLLWRGSKIEATWALFFIYFGSGWGWLISLLKDGHIAGESMFWSQQAVSTLLNPPFAASLIFLLIGAISILQYEKTRKFRWALAVILSLGIVIEVKVYAGLLALSGLGVLTLYKLLSRKLDFIWITFATTILSAGIFKFAVPSDGSIIIFKPFWFLETMMALSDRLGWQKFYDAMITYRESGNYLKMIPAYVAAYIIFLIGNMGTRLVKHFYILRQWRDVKLFKTPDIFLQTIIIVGCNIPLLFLQKGTPWNTIQFLYYPLFFSGILAGIGLGGLIEKNRNSFFVKAFSLLIILLAIPTTVSTLWLHYLPSRPPAKISNEELQALDFLNKQEDGVVLTYPFDQQAAEKAQSNPPRPLYLYDSTAYVAALSAKPVYLEDQVNLDITNYDWKSRREKVLSWLSTQDHQFAFQFLRDNHIEYIYWIKGQRATLGETQLGITQIFENNEVTIYQVN